MYKTARIGWFWKTAATSSSVTRWIEPPSVAYMAGQRAMRMFGIESSAGKEHRIDKVLSYR
jgi:hypothetical protein